MKLISLLGGPFKRRFLPVAAALALVAVSAAHGRELRIGIIGLDSSHCVAFTKILNDPSAPGHIPGARIVAAYPGGSPDIESSWGRVGRFTEEMRDTLGVKIYDSIDEVCRQADAIMILSLDGRVHLEQARAVFKHGKPVFIDKPLAASVRDAIAIFREAERAGVACFSSSSLRYYPTLQELKARDMGEIRGAVSHGPASLEPTHPDLFWYGIHAAESLYTIMGPGCETVVRTHTADLDIVTGVWKDGRVGTLIGTRNMSSSFRVTVYGSKGVFDQERGRGGYAPLVAEIIEFFRTGNVPVASKETIELFAFMEAADESKRRGGVPVRISDVIPREDG